MTALHERHHYLCSSPTYHTAAELCFLMAHMLLGCGECQERPFHSKIRVCSAPPWKATPVTLSCITTGKEPNRTSHTDDFPVPLNSEPFYRLTPALWDMQLLRQQPFSLMQCFRSNLLEKKTNRKGNPPIFCHTLHWAFFFYSTATLLYKTVRTARSAHEFSVSTSRVLHCTKLVFLHIYI